MGSLSLSGDGDGDNDNDERAAARQSPTIGMFRFGNLV
jgi:hypothetical protein